MAGGAVSIHAMTMVLDFAPDHWNSGTRLVALALADRVNHDWEAWPSIQDLARRTGLKDRMVRYHLAYLEAEGVIVREQRYRGNGSQQANLWTWLWKAVWTEGRGVHLTAPGGCTPLHPHP
jgi:DNA-binding transcriptional ArsR family regulator